MSLSLTRAQLKAMMDWLDLYGVDEIELKGNAQEVLNELFNGDEVTIQMMEESKGPKH